ncbi:SDR family oxidoreductase, partial [Paraburkholderia ginsengiterrae]|uniref:SDR family oxidoreductase n=1 Tax=Paraburkholderia ginsengiterrae TaxID=1462993 RepID=UPI0010427AE4
MAALTKGGLNSVPRSLAIEYASRGIRVNPFAPGVVRTPMHAPETLAALAKMHPSGRSCEIHDFADSALYHEPQPRVTCDIPPALAGRHSGP